MYEAKCAVGVIRRSLPVATSLLRLGLFVICAAAAHSQLTPRAEPQSYPYAAQVESGRKQSSQTCAFCLGVDGTGRRGAEPSAVNAGCHSGRLGGFAGARVQKCRDVRNLLRCGGQRRHPFVWPSGRQQGLIWLAGISYAASSSGSTVSLPLVFLAIR
jgi:hypothetical protein